jgi:hypothetical protein
VEKYLLYESDIELIFDARKHTYTVDGDVVPGVTSITKWATPADPLIGWAKNQTRNFWEAEVSARIQEWKESGCKGVPLDEVELKQIHKESFWASKKAADKAAQIGTFVHAWIEEKISGKNPALPDNENVRAGCMAFAAWAQEVELNPIFSERKIYSREHVYAGTLDVFGQVEGEFAIVDIKAANGIYLGHKLQTAAYAAAINEEFSAVQGFTGVVDRWIIRCDTTTGEPEALPIQGKEVFEEDLEAFLGTLALHRRNVLETELKFKEKSYKLKTPKQRKTA